MGNVILFGEPMALLIADSAGELKDVTHFTRSLSGAEVNVGIGLSRLGHHVTYITKLGDDPFGHFIEESLKKEGIDTSYITYDPIYRTGIQLKCMVSDGDPQAPYYRRGSAAAQITPDDMERIDFTDVDCVHITGIPPALSESCKDATFRLLELAKEHEIPVSFDPNLRPALWHDAETMIDVINKLAASADLLLPGIEEGKTLLGLNNPGEIAAAYLKMGVEQVIVKQGSDGAYGRNQIGSCYISGYKVEDVIDTVGAGDGFAVGVISALLEGLTFEDMIRRGNAIGAIQVTNQSDNEGLPTKPQLDKFMNY